ncbi:MAG: S-layer homology domain-containing protein [Sedimentibacter sp.]|uniref:GLUG motif-containing protein n=1 Tax=Sedimentibacter sp. TaxID=1960295 RepID=UPI0029817EAC|nr:S-layer homology domain-containing protein [Sedimentibacter sp.]MDW5299353.1 S-layer homology domain-containing protein [Sedimentibacter sp.]
MRQKVLSIFLSLLMVFNMFPVTVLADSQGYDFIDMPNNWSTAALKKAVDNGLLKGYADKGKNLIKADEPLKRAEMSVVVNRAFSAVKTAELNGVTDVPFTAWYASDMAKAVMMGTFMKDTTMRPESNITRQEAFVVLARAFKVCSDALEYKALENYSDKADIAPWAKKDLNAMVEAGYVQGSDGKINPNANITRAEFATVLDNLVKLYIDMPGEVIDVTLSGNILIRVPGVMLKNLTIKGDLIIADGVGDGDVTLDNVKVEGRTVVRGGGENSIVIKGNSNLGKIIVCKVDGKVRIAVEDAADVKVIYVDDGSDDVLVEGVIGTLEVVGDNITAIAAKAFLTNAIISGDNSTIIIREKSSMKEGSITGSASKIIVDKGATADKITIVGSDAKVEGNGIVKKVEVKASGDNSFITTPNTKIETAKGAEGVTAAGGALVDSSTSVTNNNTGTWIVIAGSSGSGGSSSTARVSAIDISTNIDVTAGVENDAVVTVTLATATSGAGIYYTLDGTTPTASSIKYTASFNVESNDTEGKTITVKAIGIKSGYTNSVVAEKDMVFKPIEAEFAGGTGTAEDPYQVATAEQLDNVRNHLDAHFIQIADIDLGVQPWNQGEGWMPIGENKDYPTYGNPFCGIYDGQNYTITGLTINRYSEENIGLFGYVCGKVVNYELVQQAEIKNIQLNNVEIIGQYNVGSLVGQNYYNSVIMGCSAEMVNLSYSDTSYGTFGGLIGINRGVVTDCHCTGSILGTTGVGGLVGISSGSISRSSADVEINGQGWIGGLVGNNSSGNIESCYASGNISGYYGMGGLVGQHFNGTISNTYATGNVTSHTRTQDFYIGGLIGSIGPGTVEDSYAIGAISATGDPITGPMHIGGLVGKLPDVGNQPVFNRCYYDTNTSGQSDIGKGIPKTTLEMTQQSTFSGWDFDTIWGINPDENGGYPFLRW